MNLRHSVFTLLFILGIFMCSVSVYAETYTDPMDNASSDPIKSYYNLRPTNATGTWISQLPDSSFLCFENTGQPIAKAVYKVRSAREITVSVYTHTGSFVSRMDSGSSYALGFYKIGTNMTARPPGASRALYSPSRQSVYRGGGVDFQSLFFSTYYGFMNTTETEPGDLIEYAVNAYYSLDGQSYKKIGLSPDTVWYSTNAGYCYEQFSGSVPSGAISVMVEINDFNKCYDTISMKMEPKLERMMTGLASITFTGDKLTLGPVTSQPEESSVPSESLPSSSHISSSEQSLPEIPYSSSKSSSKSSSSSKLSSSSTSKKTSANTADEEDGGASSQKTSSKFEGVITSPSSSSKAQASARSQSWPQAGGAVSRSSSKFEGETPASLRPAESEVQENPQPPATLAAEPIVYGTPAQNSNEDLFVWVTSAYIVIVVAVILFFLLRPKK